ncbi:MAG: polyprenyl synthetase family protein [Acidobacteriota bacterium]
MVSSRFEVYFQKTKTRVDETLDSLLPKNDDEPTTLHQSMRYSVFAGGKRLRPVLALVGYEIAGGRDDHILPVACGLELIHTYSLIHDDLPCMDNDDLRRGRPTNHKVYGEGMAVLAGDALLTLAFECFLGRGMAEPIPWPNLAQVARRVAEACGTLGLVGGQAMDVGLQSRDRRIETLDRTCGWKTGTLIEVSLECGARLANASQEWVQYLKRYGQALGMAFQITDDILNVTGDAGKLGKATRTDARLDKVTFPALLGLKGATQEAQRWTAQAKASLDPFGDSAWFLRELADFVMSRQN